MQLPITGPSYKNASKPTNFQRCVNMYPIEVGPSGRGQATLLPTMGSSQIIDLNSPIRGTPRVFGDNVYVVAGSDLWQLTINAPTRAVTSANLVGTLNTSTGYVSMTNNPTQLMIADGVDGYIYNKDTDVFTTINDVDFTAGTTVVFIDGYFIYNQPNTAKFWFSALNDGLTWDALHVATAESKPDLVLGLAANKGDLWVFGEETIEIWYDAANPTGSPFSRQQGAGIDVGTASAFSVVPINDTLVWLDNRGFIVQSEVSTLLRNQSSGYTLKKLSTDAIEHEFTTYPSWADAVACTYNDSGHLMYEISFPSAKKTWVLDTTLQVWHEKDYFNSYNGEQEHSLTQFACQYKNLIIAGGIRDGKIYILHHDYLTDNGVNIRRLRTTSPFTNDFKLIGVDSLEVKLKTGVVSTGLSPKIMLRYSNDSGYTYSNELIRDLGSTGEYGKRVIWNRLGTASEWLLEFKITDAVDFSIVDASVDVNVERY